MVTICKLFGCLTDEGGHGCIRCGRDLYDELPGYFWKPLQIIRGIRDNAMGWTYSHVKTYKKCAECGKVGVKMTKSLLLTLANIVLFLLGAAVALGLVIGEVMG